MVTKPLAERLWSKVDKTRRIKTRPKVTKRLLMLDFKHQLARVVKCLENIADEQCRVREEQAATTACIQALTAASNADQGFSRLCAAINTLTMRVEFTNTILGRIQIGLEKRLPLPESNLPADHP